MFEHNEQEPLASGGELKVYKARNYAHIENYLLIKYSLFLCVSCALVLKCNYSTLIRQVNILGQVNNSYVAHLNCLT